MVLWRRFALLTVCTTGICLCLATSPPQIAPEEVTELALGETIPIGVRDSESTFDLPTTTEQDQYLLIVSALSRGSGPYSVEITAEPITKPRPIERFHAPSNATWQRRIDEYRKHLRLSRREVETAEVRVAATKPAPQRTFWVMVRGNDFAQPKNYQAIRARLRATGESCSIYVDSDCAPSEQLDELVHLAQEAFDRAVYPTAQRLLGSHRDVDRDGRFAILLTPWLSRLADGTVSLGGFVRGSDFYRDLPAPFGNACDMMWLDASLPAGPHLRTMLAHEYTHAVIFSEHVFGDCPSEAPPRDEESWLNEGLAHVAEEAHGYSWDNLDHRVAAFLDAPEASPLVVPDAYAAGLWRDPGHRGAAFLFASTVSLYAIGKAGLMAATRSMAAEYERFGIRVNALSPGTVDTDMVRKNPAEAQDRMTEIQIMKRMADPDEMVGPALLLTSDAGSFMTGHVVFADGGMVPR